MKQFFLFLNNNTWIFFQHYSKEASMYTTQMFLSSSRLYFLLPAFQSILEILSSQILSLQNKIKVLSLLDLIHKLQLSYFAFPHWPSLNNQNQFLENIIFLRIFINKNVQMKSELFVKKVKQIFLRIFPSEIFAILEFWNSDFQLLSSFSTNKWSNKTQNRTSLLMYSELYYMCFPHTILFSSSVAENTSSNLSPSIIFLGGWQCCERESIYVSINLFSFLSLA